MEGWDDGGDVGGPAQAGVLSDGTRDALQIVEPGARAAQEPLDPDDNILSQWTG